MIDSHLPTYSLPFYYYNIMQASLGFWGVEVESNEIYSCSRCTPSAHAIWAASNVLHLPLTWHIAAVLTPHNFWFSLSSLLQSFQLPIAEYDWTYDGLGRWFTNTSLCQLPLRWMNLWWWIRWKHFGFGHYYS